MIIMKYQKPKHSTPLKPWDRERIERERKIVADYGLRRKKEIWRAEAMLRDWRERARGIRARRDPAKEKVLMDKLEKLGLLKNKAGLEEVLKLKTENLLERRLQTVVLRKGFASTSRQARQIIVHGHIIVNGKKVRWPSVILTSEEEAAIQYSPKSKFKAAKEWAGGPAPKTAANSPSAPSDRVVSS